MPRVARLTASSTLCIAPVSIVLPLCVVPGGAVLVPVPCYRPCVAWPARIAIALRCAYGHTSMLAPYVLYRAAVHVPRVSCILGMTMHHTVGCAGVASGAKCFNLRF
ncbi:hypothetical protein HAX54_050937, partial [Datura stramonium]|nr:hypothetical protein [Datura stramonium]